MSKAHECINWIKNYFKDNPDGKAIIGISGGKDSTIAAALCVEALGADRVIGVMMPNGVQGDISDSYEVCGFLGIQAYEINIDDAYSDVMLSNAKGRIFTYSSSKEAILKAEDIKIHPIIKISLGYKES